MKIIVTGGCGFIGSNLTKKLLELNHEVIVIDNLSNGKLKNLPKHKNLVFHKVDICDDIKDYFKDVELVFHLAALPRVQFSIDYPLESHNANINGTLNLLKICRDMKVKRFVFSSSSSVYGDQDSLPLIETMKPNPMSPYALHKLVGEYYCRLFYKIYNLETVCLRYFNVYGTGQDPLNSYANLIPKFILNAKNAKKLIINGNGEQTRDFTFISDVVEANIKAGFSDNKEILGEVFNIGAGNNISVNEVTRNIIKLNGSGIVEHGPEVIEPKDTLANNLKARELLSWSPKVGFQEGIKRYFEKF